MNKLIKIAGFAFIFVVTFFVFGNKAEAAITYTESHSPSTARTVCNTGEPVDFAAYIANVTFDTNTGVIEWDVGLGWAPCAFVATRAYAIYGSPEMCPQSGWYGLGGPAYDCVKYVGNPPFSGPGNGLACPGNTNAGCLTPGGGSILRYEQNPGSLQLDAIRMSHTIPNWGLRSLSSDSYPLSSNLCQFYKVGPPNFDTVVDNSRCLTLNLTINWTVTLGNDSGSCTATVLGTQPFQYGDTVTARLTMTNSSPRVWSVDPAAPFDHYRLRRQNGAPWPGAPYDLTPPAGSPNIETTAFGNVLRQNLTTTWDVPITLPSFSGSYSDTYSFNWQIYGYNDEQGNHNVGSVCSMVIQVDGYERPYLRVYGHDTVVGLPFADPLTGACTRPKVAGQNIETFARNNGGDFVGAGSQFAASATGLIDDYISASLRNDNPGAPATPTGLSFGNYNGGNLGFGSTGSDASGYRGCIPDYVSTLSDTYFTLGPSLGGAQVGFNYRDGDLIINSNITYPSSSTWTSLDDLQGSTGGWPVIIVKGNIYIRPSVNRIDAILIAVPEDPVKGIIGTCVPDEPAGGVFGECLNKLEINGALVARKVYFNRLNGDINNPSGDEPASSGNIAEVINFYPEFFLRFSKTTDDSSLDSKSRYESIVGLPPVL